MATALLVVLAGAAVRFGDDAGAQQGIDISGEWNIEVAGAIPLSCTATIAQSDLEFTMDMRCPTLGTGQFTGTINSETGEFSATGDLVGIPIELTGVATADGASISGSWAADLLGLSGTFTGTRAGPATTPTPLPTLPAPVDLTGTWRVNFAGVFSGECVSVIQQTGSALESVADCPLIGMVHLQGSLDELTGKATLTGTVNLHGVSSVDGNTITGTWDALGLFSGSFTAARADDVELVDLSGAWDVLLTGDLSDTCAVTIAQSLLSATAAFDCDTLGQTALAGSANPISGSVALMGELAGSQIEFGLYVAEDLRYLLGGWFATSDPLGQSGRAVAVPSGALAAGVVAVDCAPEAPGLVSDCAYSLGDKLLVSITVVAPPSGGYRGLLAGLSWSSAVLRYEPQLHLAIVTDCPSWPIGLPEDSAQFNCTVSGPTPSTSAGHVFVISMTCLNEGESSLTLSRAADGDEGTHFVGEDGAVITPTLISASVICYGPQQGGPGPPVGDGDCNGRSDSVDAALVLQLEAGLIASLPCERYADVNRDERVNSVDASLILQYEAGLIPDLG